MSMIDGLKNLYNSIFLNNDLLISRLRKKALLLGTMSLSTAPKK